MDQCIAVAVKVLVGRMVQTTTATTICQSTVLFKLMLDIHQGFNLVLQRCNRCQAGETKTTRDRNVFFRSCQRQHSQRMETTHQGVSRCENDLKIHDPGQVEVSSWIAVSYSFEIT